MKRSKIIVASCIVLLIAGSLMFSNKLTGQGRETYLSTSCTAPKGDKCIEDDGYWECTDTSCSHSLSQSFGSGDASSVLKRRFQANPVSTLTTNDDTTSAQRDVTLVLGAEYKIILVVHASAETSLHGQTSLSD